MRGLRVLLIALVALLAWLQYRLWLGEGGAESARALDMRVQSQVAENRGLRQRNEQLAAEVEDLKSGEAAAEERARSELGMIKPGETFYRVVEPKNAVDIDEAASGGADNDAANSAAGEGAR
jgi:cell division protein FtsB